MTSGELSPPPTAQRLAGDPSRGRGNGRPAFLARRPADRRGAGGAVRGEPRLRPRPPATIVPRIDLLAADGDTDTVAVRRVLSLHRTALTSFGRHEEHAGVGLVRARARTRGWTRGRGRRSFGGSRPRIRAVRSPAGLGSATRRARKHAAATAATALASARPGGRGGRFGVLRPRNARPRPRRAAGDVGGGCGRTCWSRFAAPREPEGPRSLAGVQNPNDTERPWRSDDNTGETVRRRLEGGAL